MSTQIKSMVAVLAVILGLAGAGCGGGDDDDMPETVTVGATATSEPLTKAEYIEQADAICREWQEGVSTLSDEFDAAVDRGDYDTAADLFEERIAVLREGQDELAALPKPRGDERVLGEIEQVRQTVLGLAERVIDALRVEDSARIRSLGEELKSAQDELSAIDLGYGLEVCGQQ